MRVVVTGSRYWLDEQKIRDELSKLPVMATIVHGGCKTGADVIVQRVAEEMNMDVEVFEADWERHGKRAGPIRNQEMIDSEPDLVLAFPMKDSKGTWDCIRKSRAAHIETIVVE